MDKLTIVNPVAEARRQDPATALFDPAERLETLSGKTIGLYWNGKNNGQYALAETRSRIEERFPDTKFLEYTGAEGGVLRRASDTQLDAMAAECDAVVGTTADCGSCTSWLVRDMSEIERRGTPALCWTAAEFREDASFSANIFGCPHIGIIEVPECFTSNSLEVIGKMVDDAMEQLIGLLTVPHTSEPPTLDRLAMSNAKELSYSGVDLLACSDEMNRQFVEARWSDGLPLVPPTPEKVAAMVAASGLPAHHVVGEFEPGFGVGTVEKLAANAVMAGCEPEHMPIVVAFAKCLVDPRMGTRFWGMSTGPQAPIVLVSGPYAKAIGMNSGVCAIGPSSTSHANVVIGRATRLIMMNVGLAYPGVSDMDTQGSTMKFGYCVAENEERNPWDPYRVTQGFSKDCTTVTINCPYGADAVYDFENDQAESLARVVADAAGNPTGPHSGYWLVNDAGDKSGPALFAGDPTNLLMLSPEHARNFARAGWSLQDIKHRVFELCRQPFEQVMLNHSYDLFKKAQPNLQWLLDNPTQEVSLFMHEDTIDIFVVGGDAGWSTWHRGGTYSITREVDVPGS